MNAQEWLDLGIDRGWIGQPFCYVHGYPALTDEEDGIVEEEGGMDAIRLTVARLEVQR